MGEDFCEIGVTATCACAKICGMRKRWKVRSSEVRGPESGGIYPNLLKDLHPIAEQLLANRGITSEKEIREFLNPDWDEGIHDPFLFSQMQSAVDRVFEALEIGERITVYGDYDADGVTSCVIVIDALREIGQKLGHVANVDYYIPHRDKEGYGLHAWSIALLKERGTSLLITVDCGIANVNEIALAKERGIDTIVVDHHEFGDELPNALLIHPNLPNESYPFKHLAAVGVTWKFACALLIHARNLGAEIPKGWEKWLLDLVSIATVTDMVPLTGENRVLLKYGLIVLNKTRRKGLRGLIRISGKNLGELDSESIGYSLGPRINAAGRMDHAERALKLLLSEEAEEAARRSEELEMLNRERQNITKLMMKQAEQGIEEHEKYSILVLWDKEWSPALVGLVAGRFLDRYGKPCVCIGKHGDKWIGSGRAPSFYNITEAVRSSGEGLLTRAGGHAQACGFSFVQDEQAPLFAQRLREHALISLANENLKPEIEIHAELRLEDLDWELIKTLQYFEPYGIGNPRPLFQTQNLEVTERSNVGQIGSHMRCLLRSDSGLVQKFMGFRMGERLEEMTVGSKVDVVYDVGVNEWNGQRTIECKLNDFRTS